jgi:hypothetical protein
MTEEFYANRGPLLSPAKLADLPTHEMWDCDEKAEAAQTAIREALEKHADLLRSDATEPQTKYFIVNPTLHALGYIYSIAEPVPIQNDATARVDYVLFASSDNYAEAEPMRGTTAFFRSSVGICQATSWNDTLDVSEDPEAAAQQPMVVIDLLLRYSGVQYGIVSNGRHWRLVHRSSSEHMTTFLEFDLEKLASAPLEQFKYFYLTFGRESLRPTVEGICFVNQLLAE